MSNRCTERAAEWAASMACGVILVAVALPAVAQTAADSPATTTATGTATAVTEGETAREQSPKASTGAKAEDVIDTLREGAWFVGGTLGATVDRADNQHGALSVTADAASYGVRAQMLAGRVLSGRDLGVGLALQLRRNERDRTQETDTGPQRAASLSKVWGVGPMMRQFLALTEGGRFYFFYQATFLVARTNSLTRNFQAESASITEREGYGLELNVTPGLAVFGTENLSVEVAFDVVGVTAAWEKTRTDYVETGKTSSFGMNLNVNLLSLSFAFVGYF